MSGGPPDRETAAGDVPPSLLIPVAIHDAMVAQCLREAPLECCGLLAGIAPQVARIYPLRNAEASETRYEADPRDLIHAVTDMRGLGFAIVGIYHSHPKSRAVPSRTDLARNHYGDVPRLIVSLLGEPEVRVWRLGPDSYEEIPWRLVPGDEPLAVKPRPDPG